MRCFLVALVQAGSVMLRLEKYLKQASWLNLYKHGLTQDLTMICLDKRFCLFVSEHTFKYIWGFTSPPPPPLLGPGFVLVSQNLTDAEIGDESGALSEHLLLF